MYGDQFLRTGQTSPPVGRLSSSSPLIISMLKHFACPVLHGHTVCIYVPPPLLPGTYTNKETGGNESQRNVQNVQQLLLLITD